MIIIVAGIYRSGSTWLFNAVRFMVEESGRSCQGRFIWQTIPTNRVYDCHVVKTHAYYTNKVIECTPDFIVTSRRNTDQIIESMKQQRERGVEKQFKNAGQFKKVNTFLKWLDKWQKNPAHCYELDYQMLEDKRIKEILIDLSFHLKLNVSGKGIERVEKRLSEMKPPLEGFDPETLLTRTHKRTYESTQLSD